MSAELRIDGNCGSAASRPPWQYNDKIYGKRPMAESKTNDRAEWNFQLDLFKNDQPIHRESLKPSDFVHAVYATTFDALRCQQTDLYRPLINAARLLPIFPQANSPQTTGFIVDAELPSGERHQGKFGIGYFMSRVSRLQTRLVRENKLEFGTRITYRLTAYFDEPIEQTTHSKLPISLDPPEFQVNIRRGLKRDLGEWQPWDEPDGQDMPVVVDQSVLDQAIEHALSAPEQEVAGVLFGHVMQDEQDRQTFLSVTGFTAGAGTTLASSTSVTFTPATFAKAQEIIQLRGAGETIVGWFHSHPFRFCAQCPLPTPPECISKVLFYSQDDVHLMERTFDQPFMVGLLAAVEPRIEAAIGHLPVRLFGWRRGSVENRGFHVVDMPANTNPVSTNSLESNTQQEVLKEKIK